MCRSRRGFGEVGGGDVVEVEEVLSEGLMRGVVEDVTEEGGGLLDSVLFEAGSSRVKCVIKLNS